MRKRIKYVALWGAYLFGGSSCIVGVILCSLLLICPGPPGSKEALARKIISLLCGGLVLYLKAFGLLEVDFSTLLLLARRRGIIITANHPTYIDALLIMSQVDNVFCVTKSSVIKNPWVSAMVQAAGYEQNLDPAFLIERCGQRLSRGENLLIFPEGTRTILSSVGQFKRGFSLMAARASAPVITLMVSSCNGSYLQKGHSFWSLPRALPLRYALRVTGEFTIALGESTRHFCDKIEAHYRQPLQSCKSDPNAD